jgi:hypothetical protein
MRLSRVVRGQHRRAVAPQQKRQFVTSITSVAGAAWDDPDSREDQAMTTETNHSFTALAFIAASLLLILPLILPS